MNYPFLLSLLITISQSPTTDTIASADKERPSQGIIIRKKTQGFLDIETKRENLWFGCTKGRSEKGNSYMVFYALNGDESYSFFYRRPLGTLDCLKVEKEYKSLIGKSRTVRLACDHPDIEAGPTKETSSRIPSRFTAVRKVWSCFFGRVQADNRCKAYFHEDCDLPRRYWLDSIPE